jgi:hypothetical protein
MYFVRSWGEEYIVVGTRGIDYRVEINEANWMASRCTCPDFSYRHQLCKHIFYILQRVKRMTQEQLMALQVGPIAERTPSKTEEGKDYVDQDCAICYDAFQKQEKVKLCEECNKPFHTTCLKIWQANCRKKKIDFTCPLCRHLLH